MTVRLLMIEIVLREAYLPLFEYRGRADFFDQSGEIRMPARTRSEWVGSLRCSRPSVGGWWGHLPPEISRSVSRVLAPGERRGKESRPRQ